MKDKRPFGVSSLQFEVPRKGKAITGDINIYIADNGFGVIYFDHDEQQVFKIVATKQELIDLIKDVLKDRR